jgi:voltage-gated potassium channel
MASAVRADARGERLVPEAAAPSGPADRRERWERAVHWPLAAAALLFLVSYAWPILDTGLSEGGRLLASWLTWSTWGLFALDYVVRLALARNRVDFVRRNLLDLAAVALPLLRPLRLLRLVTLLSVLQREAGSSLRGRVVTYVIGATTLLALIAALAVLDAERGSPDATITSFGGAVWWAVTTITTVGYGDLSPVTSTGRVLAVGLMIAGIAVLGVVTATLASWLVERVSDDTRQIAASEAATAEHVEHLTRLVEQLHARLEDVESLPARETDARSSG